MTVLRSSFLIILLAASVTSVLSLPYGIRQAPPTKIWDGVFTAEQARRGKGEYDQTCSRCHNLALIGSERGPSIKGTTFLSHWEKGSLSDLFIKIRDTMPEGGPGTLNEDVKTDILSYILQQNGFPEGKTELKKDVSFLEDIRMAKKGIWDGVFTTTQADRGTAALSQNGCNGCHGADLSGARGPSLKGERFIKEWENGSINRLFIKIRDTMPPANAQQVSESAKVDIIASLLQANDFPAGLGELALESLDGVQIVRKGAEAAGVPNFSLVQVLGCLVEGPNGRWVLANSTEPTPTKEEVPTPAGLKSAETQSLGTATLDLVSVGPSFKAETHKGHKMDARGLLYKEPRFTELNLTSLTMVSSSCGK